MKFGKNLIKNQVLEFSSKYINYKGLKKEITNICSKSIDSRDFTSFFLVLDDNIKLVETFFNQKKNQIVHRIGLIVKKYHLNLLNENNKSLNLRSDEKEDLLILLLSLRSDLQKILWYAEMNKKGFSKILKKVDKKFDMSIKSSYMESKILAFLEDTTIIELLQNVNNYLSYLNNANSSKEFKRDIMDSIIDISSNSSFVISPVLATEIQTSIYQNNADNFQILIDKLRSKSLSNILINLIQQCLVAKSLSCIKVVFPYLDVLIEDEEINDRNLIHKHVIDIGRCKINALKRTDKNTSLLPYIDQPIYLAPTTTNLYIYTGNSNSCDSDPIIIEETESLEFLLSQFRPIHYKYLSGQDIYQRLPLHYAVQYGLLKTTQLILDYMVKWGQLDPKTDNLNNSKWKDSEGYTPLHWAILIRNIEILKTLQTMNQKIDPLCHGKKIIYEEETESNNTYSALALAVKLDYDEIVYQLLESGMDINHQNKEGESPLHIATRLNNIASVKILLNGTKNQKQNTELRENLYGWTSLFIAAAEGFIEILQLLVSANAKINDVDFSGWTALEHAVFRGHMNCVNLLLTPDVQKFVQKHALIHGNPDNMKNVHKFTIYDKNDESQDEIKEDNSSIPLPENDFAIKVASIKSFDHDYLKDELMIVVTLGSTDIKKKLNPVEINEISFIEASISQLDTPLSLIVKAKNADGGSTVIDLPTHYRIETEPIIFITTNYEKMELFFDIVPTYSKNRDVPIGRAVAVLSTIKKNLGKAKESLNGELKIPILEVNTLSVIGTINFEFRVITPFKHPNMTTENNSTYWKSLIKTRVIGHRGLGENRASKKSLQLGENTLQSFISAANLGASYVEFDVQLTKDYIPIIYHDFLVSETGIDIPVHNLTLQQFLALSDTKQSKSSTFLDKSISPLSSKLKFESVKRSKSQYFSNFKDQNELYERIKYTRDFKIKGYKGNARGQSIQGPFMTLEEAFKEIPTNVGFNIECKYPMLHEAENEEMDNIAIELNKWVDTVLKIVYDHKKDRDIIFSSFHPEVCLLLSYKQPSIPIMFLTDANISTRDIRSASLQEAIRFATRWNLLGIVCKSDPLVLCPRLIRVIKDSGLVCVTYGSGNNVPENVKLQIQAGLDAVIVDSVLEIRKGLTIENNDL
ncbi:hypothetical protein PNEG_00744 [Pneumocystis murina B123]|uniref:GP-PDE domain-containing protein n=1 Tax=Pneumocystis murina (strain B123) TaxID=1069680 RepID=M7NR00_PNEMU|nr:hypothetical protein PNEG_00744 [Pneumocystis murina B123]EMR11148.1 hypothetical protein PNEG_00744 [Pneumocystis murina B123]